MPGRPRRPAPADAAGASAQAQHVASAGAGAAAQGLQVQVVSNWLHLLTVWETRQIIRTWKPDVVFAHGFSDHIWGRQAALAEKVPRIFHVEHNARERYTPVACGRRQALAPFTEASIGVSEGVRTSLLERGFAPEQCLAIPNGIALDRFPDDLLPAHWSDREGAILMAARFARQDHGTLINALALLRSRGQTPALELAGTGSAFTAPDTSAGGSPGPAATGAVFGECGRSAPALGKRAGFCLVDPVGRGMPLALVEAMAAGCACIGTDVVGVREVIEHGITGLLVPPDDAAALADDAHAATEPGLGATTGLRRP